MYGHNSRLGGWTTPKIYRCHHVNISNNAHIKFEYIPLKKESFGGRSGLTDAKSQYPPNFFGNTIMMSNLSN